MLLSSFVLPHALTVGTTTIGALAGCRAEPSKDVQLCTITPPLSVPRGVVDNKQRRLYPDVWSRSSGGTGLTQTVLRP